MSAHFPVSDHCDGHRFFNPRGQVDRTLLDVLRWKFGSKAAAWESRVVISPGSIPARPQDDSVAVTWINHATFLIQARGLALITDPIYSEIAGPLGRIGPRRVHAPGIRFDDLPDLRAVLLSHDHYDHCSLADIEKLRGPHTLVIGNERVAAEIGDCMVIRPWQCVTIDRVSVKAVPAYSPNHWRHPADEGGLGFVISANMYDIYYAGDTQRIPEMADIQPDIAILPIDGDGTMNAQEAAELVETMRPRWAIPSNWGTASEGASKAEALAFKEQAEGICEVCLLPQTS